MIRYNVRVYLCDGWYDVELWKDGKYQDGTELPNWKEASARARSLCRKYGLQTFATYRVRECHVSK